MVLKIISAQDVLFEGEVSKVSLPGANGTFMVLPGHASLISTLVPGKVVYGHDGQTSDIEVAGGIVDVDNNIVSVCIY
jgi:F-type H+-transporting ATPase subunit epsilon